MYEWILSLLDGVDLVKYDFLPALILSLVIVLCIGITFRALLTIFNVFFGR